MATFPTKDTLIPRLKTLEQAVVKTTYTQIFMETPYRNQFVWDCMMTAFSDKNHVAYCC